MKHQVLELILHSSTDVYATLYNYISFMGP